MSNPTREENSETSRFSLASSPNRPLMIGNMSANQLNCFLSICRFEEKNSVKIGESAVLATTLAKEAEIKNDYLNKNADLIVKEYFKAATQIRIPASIPLKLPDSAKELVKENSLEKLSVTSDLNTNSIKIALRDRNGVEKILISGQANHFKNHPRKDVEIGLSISEDSHLNMSIPKSPATIESKSSKNQGNVLYNLGIVGVDKKNG